MTFKLIQNDAITSEGIPLVGEAGGELPLLLPRTLYRAHTHFRAQFFDTAWSTSMFCFEKHPPTLPWGFGLMIAAYQVGFTRPQLSSALYAAG